MSKTIDALLVLEEVAVSLKESAEGVSADSDFERGRRMGYYEALSTLLSQCAMAGIEPDEIGMTGFQAEQILHRDKAA